MFFKQGHDDFIQRMLTADQRSVQEYATVQKHRVAQEKQSILWAKPLQMESRKVELEVEDSAFQKKQLWIGGFARNRKTRQILQTSRSFWVK